LKFRFLLREPGYVLYWRHQITKHRHTIPLTVT
jgi:hypothetical protein